jgi:hypothetical protein
LADRLETLEQNGAHAANGAPAYAQTPLAQHLQRYGVFYAFGVILALVVWLLPTRDNTGSTQAQQANSITSTDNGTGGDVGTGPVSSATTGGPAAGTASAASSAPNTGQPSLTAAQIHQLEAQIVPWAWNKSGKTIGGFNCSPGVRQLPWSDYAVPCYPHITLANNGGKTATGVTSNTIVVVSRHFPDSASSQAVNAFVAQAGFATGDAVQAADNQFRAYFAKVFELWGRKVQYIDYLSKNGNSTDEALGQGQEGACADADDIISHYHPFMVVGTGKNGGMTGVFAVCAAQRHLFTYGGGAYYPEWWYQKYHPYAWNGTMNCTMIAYQNAEYIGKRLNGRPPKWAKLAQARAKTRVFGLYVPTNVEYQSCVDLANSELSSKYGMNEGGKGQAFKSRVNYQLDVTRLADQAQVAIAKFQKDGVTTIFMACDPLSPIFLTQDATQQAYNPEWVTNGAGLTDVEQFARLWDQTQINHSLFGMSQVDTPKVLQPTGEGSYTYKKATGQTIPPGTQTQYYAELSIFNLLQAAGPILTYDNIAKAIWSLPPAGMPNYEVGYAFSGINPDGSTTASAWCRAHGVNHGCQHTSVDDMREIYWVCTSYATDASGASRCSAPKAYDGHGGEYLPTYNDKRFRNGQWPAESPPIYPKGTWVGG